MSNAVTTGVGKEENILQRNPVLLDTIAEEVKVKCVLNSILMIKNPNSAKIKSNHGNDTSDNDYYVHAPISLLPIDFPVKEFTKAKKVAPLFNTLVEKVSTNRDYLFKSLESVLPHDDFSKKLWDIYDSNYEETKQLIHVGINRSDYLLDGMDIASSKILQVELNTIASSLAGLSTKVSSLHREIIRQYDPYSGESCILPTNPPCKDIATALILGCYQYIMERKLQHGQVVKIEDVTLLFIVQPNERNFVDQKLLESEINNECPNLTIKRVTLAEIHDNAIFTGPPALLRKRGVVYVKEEATTKGHGTSKACEMLYEGKEVALCYFRAGYMPNDYPTEIEW